MHEPQKIFGDVSPREALYTILRHMNLYETAQSNSRFFYGKVAEGNIPEGSLRKILDDATKTMEKLFRSLKIDVPERDLASRFDIASTHINNEISALSNWTGTDYGWLKVLIGVSPMRMEYANLIPEGHEALVLPLVERLNREVREGVS